MPPQNRKTYTVYKLPGYKPGSGVGHYLWEGDQNKGRAVPMTYSDYNKFADRGQVIEREMPTWMLNKVMAVRDAQARGVGVDPNSVGGPEQQCAAAGGVMINGKCFSGPEMDEDGGSGNPWSSTREAAEYEAAQRAAEAAAEHQRQKELLEMQHAWEVEQKRIERELAEKARLEALRQERLSIFTDLMGKDPVRGVLFAMGVGGTTTQLPTERFAELEPMTGAMEKKAETEGVLNKMFQDPNSGISDPKGAVSLSGQGVENLVGAEQSARLLMQGAGGDIENTRKLLASAYGVGGPTTGRAGISADELMRRARSVTPTGVLKSAGV